MLEIMRKKKNYDKCLQFIQITYLRLLLVNTIIHCYLMTLFITAGSEGSSTIRQRQVQLPVPAGDSSIKRFGDFPEMLRHFHV